MSTGDKKRRNRLKLHQERFGLYIRKCFIIVRRGSVIKDCLRSSRNLHHWRPLSEGYRNTPQRWVRADPAPRQVLTLQVPSTSDSWEGFWLFLAALLKRKKIVPSI